METSAKTGVNVELAFHAIARSETLFLYIIYINVRQTSVTIDNIYCLGLK